MIERDQAYRAIVEHITDQLVVTGIGSQTASLYKAKDRPENLYLRGPMGLAPAVGLGVALAHPERKVVAIEGDGSLLMALSSLAAVAHNRPKNFMLICMDNGAYEAGGKGPTVNVGRTDFVKTAQGLGIALAESVEDLEALKQATKRLLDSQECSFLHVRIGARKGPFNPPKLRPFEMKHQFLSALRKAPPKP
jgi:thiamine pyrophosphate-dependent acetolactate synthase large subunit-like protein